MCKASSQVCYPTTGPEASRGEDAAAQIELYRRCSVIGLRHAGYLFTYVYHGGNTFERAHHRMIVDWMAMDQENARPHRETLVRHLDEYLPVTIDRLSLKNGQRMELRSGPRPP
jgi:hypothetical protein